MEVSKIDSLGSGELTLLRRLAINPHLRPVDIARDLGVTRSAVSQTWNRLQEERNLNVCSNIDLGKIGLYFLFGWAQDEVNSKTIRKFAGWLASNPFVTSVQESLMTSSLDSIVTFEAILPVGSRFHWFVSQLGRFTKRPYNLTIAYDAARTIASHINIGSFDGASWDFSGGFKFEASIDAVKGFAEILPIVRTMNLSTPTDFNLEIALIAAAMEFNYLISSYDLESWLKSRGIDDISTRTLRRRLSFMREEVAIPYISLNNIGLKQNVVVCLNEQPSKGNISRLLHAQAITFPKTRIISGNHLTVMDMGLPETVDWLSLSNSFTQLAQPPNRLTTSLISSNSIRKTLESVVLNLDEIPRKTS